MTELPKKYEFKEAEKKWQEYWEAEGTHKWNEDTTREESFVINTPPPTVSGKLHMGHIASFAQADFVARYKRMSGMNVFYPVGFDDNGLPTERYTEQQRGIRGTEMDREEFKKICAEETEKAEEQFKRDFSSMAFSIDWDQTYQTISKESRILSQMSFMDLYEKGFIYRNQEPVIWDVIDQTALAQAELEDKEFDSVMNDILFGIEGSDEKMKIATTRPELLPACVAVFVHPDDERYKNLVGKNAITPLFEVKVPIIADEDVNMEKGTGIVMCCTFGDQQDVIWWKKHNLPLRMVLNKVGRIEVAEDDIADKKYVEQIQGLKAHQAREKVLELLKEKELLVGQTPIKHMVKCGERSKKPVEILVTPQWFIKVLDIKDELLAKANECVWHPAHMKARIENWINGLGWDWCISRQRFSGVHIPVWYSKRKGEEGKVILPEIDQLPVDPNDDKCLPRGYSRDEVEGEKDILDTWATSGLTPQLSSKAITEKYAINYERHLKLYPADLQTHAHEIIRTWDFSSLVKSYYHENSIPWKHVMISGWILAEDKSKMSKSKGNVITPQNVVEEHGTDTVRYWASNNRLGVDSAYSEDTIKVGKKLITKLWNVAKFASMHFENMKGSPATAKEDVEKKVIFETLDKWILSRLAKTIATATADFEGFEYAKARETVEDFFWNDFCDNYLEMVKIRCYGPTGQKYEGVELSDVEKEKLVNEQQSGIYAIYHCLYVVLHLFAPFVPHITEEIYSLVYFEDFAKNGSINRRGSWPKVDNCPINEDAEKAGAVAVNILAEVRKYKSDNSLAMNAKLQLLNISYPEVELIPSMVTDLKNVTGSEEIEVASGEFEVEIK